MAMQPFSHNTRVSTKLDGQRRGVVICFPCTECETEHQVLLSWAEVTAILSGRDVSGMRRDALGWVGDQHCNRADCHTGNGNRTQLRYRVKPTDLLGYWQNAKALGVVR